ncbi:FeoB-associated Cys-rich membrane protein [Cytobacillus sp. IB215665]|uniref:FeoB-associated Cys-rich membrane protein n=1 Tax=Cytobacillus sp. IB215665 TaxID=3097357 RepID=UPI002A1263E7|nr:FeoB-associated Cys-rich membrane protein [Cytobacillus sp. IB215665]MDX8364487.1 FeoB-associated Cys-rich membrane protein [Cytobacillus sp. IB215665]
MVVNIVLGTLIIGYAAFMLLKSLKRSSKGKCANCSSSCQLPCAHTSTVHDEVSQAPEEHTVK